MKTPQEKKRLSLKKDRRNTYGENNKSSRTGIPLRKAKAHRRNRHRQDNLLHTLPDASNEDALVALENEIKGQAPNPWKKYPDTPLGETLERQQAWRETQEERRMARPANLHQATEDFMADWFDQEIRSLAPPEYVALKAKVYGDLHFKNEIQMETMNSIYELLRGWELRV